jgi:sirohydrochlorin ferrochelatase
MNLITLVAAAALAAPAKPGYGILLLAHGGNPEWNREVIALKDKVAAKADVEVAFGMADSAAMQSAVEALESRKAKKIVAVPLFINSRSEVLTQTRYVLGIDDKPSELLRKMLAAHPHAAHAGHSFSTSRIKTKLPVTLAPALDDHPFVAQILLERARALSKNPAQETVVLVGHGPVDEEAEAAWLRTMRNLAASVAKNGGFRSVLCATLRDDAPEPVRKAAVADLRKRVERAALDSRAIVVPYLIARGGVEDHIVVALKGLRYAWDAKPLMPHESLARWVLESAEAGARKEDMRRFK